MTRPVRANRALAECRTRQKRAVPSMVTVSLKMMREGISPRPRSAPAIGFISWNGVNLCAHSVKMRSAMLSTQRAASSSPVRREGVCPTQSIETRRDMLDPPYESYERASDFDHEQLESRASPESMMRRGVGRDECNVGG